MGMWEARKARTVPIAPQSKVEGRGGGSSGSRASFHLPRLSLLFAFMEPVEARGQFKCCPLLLLLLLLLFRL